MNRSLEYFRVLSVVGLAAVLGVARGLDTWIAFLQLRNAQTFSLPGVLLASYALAALSLAAVLLLLFWFVLMRTPRTVWVGLIYLVSGLLIAFYSLLYFSPLIGGLGPVSYWFMPSPASYLSSAGAFAAMIGLFSLVLPREE
jgi:hypothetical protein